jgi:phosphoenolpyruvate-protein kinase (PTS system EI component)
MYCTVQLKRGLRASASGSLHIKSPMYYSVQMGRRSKGVLTLSHHTLEAEATIQSSWDGGLRASCL